MPYISEETATVMMDIIEFATDGTWPQLKEHLLERSSPALVEKAGEEIADAASQDNPFEGEVDV